MIADNFNDFVEKVTQAERNALNNTAYGQELSEKLLKETLKKYPDLTPEKWAEIKSEFLTFIFYEFIKNHPDAMKELATHTYNELNKGV